MYRCKQCGVEIEVVKGKVQKQFCTDAHRKAYKRAELRKSEATAVPSVDELRTNSTKLSTSDNLRQPISDKALPSYNVTPEHVQALEESGKAQIVTAVTNLTNKPKRGKDIKVFADLPPDIQRTIDRMSINKDGTVNQTVKANRTAIAVNYQHQFPGKYHPECGVTCRGVVVTGKPGDADYNGICTPEWRAERGR